MYITIPETNPIKKVVHSHLSRHLGSVAALFKLNLTSNVQLMNLALIM